METNTKEKNSLGFKAWFAFILVGLIGQLAWAIENQYINLYVYSQTGDASYINYMTTFSAITATLTTLLVGPLSDKLGKRKPIIAIGYMFWGISVALFGVASFPILEQTGLEPSKAIMWVGILNVIIDCVMTLFGSTSNDACFSSYITDQTNENNRPLVESVISILPLIALALMMGLGLALGVPGSKNPNETQSEFATRIATPWLYFYIISGAITFIVGLVSLFILPKDKAVIKRDDGFLKNLIYGFKPSSIKENKKFYLTLLCFFCFNIAIDSFMPYYLVYFQEGLKIQGLTFYLIMGSIVLISSVITILFGLFMEKIGKGKILFGSILVLAISSLLLYLTKDQISAGIGGTLLMSAYLIGTSVLGVCLRDTTPSEKVGSLQGVRMIMAVMLPMIIGSNIALASFSSNYVNEFNEVAKMPDKNMFLVTLVASILTICPAYFLFVFKKKKENIETK